MSTTIIFRFPGGHYHATPWGHHVNEGLIEWPPSPWRLVRAMIATAFTKLDVPDPVPAWHPLRRLVESLASSLPTFRLPCSSPATHTRHYMPKAGGKPSLVLDAYAVVGQGELVVTWDLDLDVDCRVLLDGIVTKMSYLGRAESWVEARVLSDKHPIPDGDETVPHVDGLIKGVGWEQVSLLAPVSAQAYASWRRAAVAEALQELPLSGNKVVPAKLMKERMKKESPYPVDLFACLTRDTAWLKSHGWSQPPGSRRVLFWRRTEALTVGRPVSRRHVKAERPVGAMLLALTSDSQQGDVLPLFSRCLPQAELLHRALVGKVGQGDSVDCPVLTGRDAEGQRLVGHRHLHIIPLSLDHPGRIDHFLLWSPGGLDSRAQECIRDLRRIWTKGVDHDLFVSVAGMGALADVESAVGSDVLGSSRVWISRTPFVPPRHLKKSGVNDLSHQVVAELSSRGLPVDVQVEVLDRELWAESGFHRFVRVRRAPAKAPPQDVGVALRLIFPVPVTGPLCLGYASHFGMGVFSAQMEG